MLVVACVAAELELMAETDLSHLGLRFIPFVRLIKCSLFRTIVSIKAYTVTPL